MKVLYDLELHLLDENEQSTGTVSFTKYSNLPDMAIFEGQTISIGFRGLPEGYQPTIEFTVDYFLLFDPVDEESFYHIHFVPTRISNDDKSPHLCYGFLEAVKQDPDWS